MQTMNSMRLPLGIRALFAAAECLSNPLTPTVNLLPPVTLDSYNTFDFATGLFTDQTNVPDGNTVMLNGTLNLNLPGSSLNPLTSFTIPPSASVEGDTIVNTVQVAQQQVQAALLYLQDHQSQILAGKDQFF